MGKVSYCQKKLSWAYRKKAKIERNKLGTDTVNNINGKSKNARIIVRNLSFEATEEAVRKFYEAFGEVEEVNLLKHQNGKLVGCGFVQFKCMEEASKAIFNTNKKNFLGRIISSDWAISKSKFCKKLEENLGMKETDKSDEQPLQDIHKQDHKSNDSYQKEKDDLKKQKRRKLQKMKKQKKRARIVIRNLSFEATDDTLKEYFSQYGDIEEIKILTKSNGKCTGCAFIQFDRVQSAAKAIHYANMQFFLHRAIIVDWAMPKNKFSKNSTDNNDDIMHEIKIEDTYEDKTQNNLIKVSHSSKNEINDLVDDESDREEIITDNIKEENESDEKGIICKTDIDKDNDSEISSEFVEEKKCYEENSDLKRPRWKSNDVHEGKTVFLKNVPFSVNNDELRKYMEQFGPVYYALVCIDSLTEHSKGTAFVKFKDTASVEKCLSNGSELRMHGQIIEAYKALHKNEVENKRSLKEQKVKDSRNLYLIKEGVILAGSAAAAEVSVSDMAKRLKLEQWKSQMLRNLNMFVSRVRLVVHNLPVNLDDIKLRQLFKNHSGPKAVIREARVMRDLKNVDATGKGKSKEYGFVTFTNHEDALKALRSINNNPNMFSKSKRPIVGFSIEDRTIVNAKEKRLQKSRERNPLWFENELKRKNKDVKEKVLAKRVKTKKLDDSSENMYAGTIGKLGQDKLRSNFHLKSQAKLHMRLLKKEKKLNKTVKEKKENMKEKQKTISIKQKNKFDADDVNFNKLVNNYRNKLEGIDLKKSKWYETSMTE